MSVILNTLANASKQLNGTVSVKDTFDSATNKASIKTFPLPPDYENEPKFKTNKEVNAISPEIDQIFSPIDRYDDSRDGFFLLPESAEYNDYLLLSIQIDLVKFNDKGQIVDAGMIQRSGHQLRLRMAFHPDQAVKLAGGKGKALNKLNGPELLKNFGADFVYGTAEVSIKSLLSDNKDHVRSEFEVPLEERDIVGTILRQKGDVLPPELRDILIEALNDPNTDIASEAVCMTDRLAFHAVHYMTTHKAHTLYECTFDSNHFADVRLRNWKRLSDRETEFESKMLYTVDRQDLPLDKQEEILNQSSYAVRQHVRDVATSFEDSWGSKLERAGRASRIILESSKPQFNFAAAPEFNRFLPEVHPALLLQINPFDILENGVKSLYNMSQRIKSPICEDSPDWIKNAHKREAFFDADKKKPQI